jgi:hypothetical protein
MADDDRDLGLDATITRKDFLNATLLGVGGALLGSVGPAWARAAAEPNQSSGDALRGSGTGDYARSNGNTRRSPRRAQVRDRAYGPTDDHH